MIDSEALLLLNQTYNQPFPITISLNIILTPTYTLPPTLRNNFTVNLYFFYQTFISQLI